VKVSLPQRKRLCGKEKIGRELPLRRYIQSTEAAALDDLDFSNPFTRDLRNVNGGIFYGCLYQSTVKIPFTFSLFTWWFILNDSKLQTRCKAVVKINIFLHGQVCHLVFRFSSAACGFSFTTIK